MLKTTDGGDNWIDIFNSGVMRDMYFKDSLNGIGVNLGSSIKRTTNGGINWSFYTISPPGDFYRISIINNFTGFVVSSNGYDVYKTTNFGESFDSVGYIPGVIESISSSEFINENVGWAGANFGQIFKTENGGRTWRLQSHVNNAFLSGIYALNDSVVWMCGAGGTIIHTTNGGDTITSINQISTNIPESFELKQNYPNPFNPTTNIQYELPVGNFVVLKIYDINGREIKTLINEFKPAGRYLFSFNASELSSGIYIYKIISGNFNETKRMVLIK